VLALKRRIEVFAVQAITKSTVASSGEFVLHVPSEYDYRFTSNLRDGLIMTLKELYIKLKGKNLPIYGIPNAVLKDCVSSKSDIKKNISRIPDAQYRLASEDLLLEAGNKSSDTEGGFDESFLKGKCVFRANKSTESIKTSDFKFSKFLNKSVNECNYLVECTTLNKTLLMKEFKNNILLDTSKMTRDKLEDEIEKLEHPFLAYPLFVFQTSSGLYFFFETTKEGTLANLLEKNKRLPEQQVQFYVMQLALILQYLQQDNNFIRNLLPENILIDDKGYLLVNPFNMYQFLDEKKKKELARKEITETGQEKYFPPEFVEGELITPAINWWSLGIILYKMLVGITPYFAPDLQILKEHIACKPLKFPDPIKHHIFVSDLAIDLITKVLFNTINSY